MSFGGMLALEVARHVPCRGVVMISSCHGGNQLAPWLQLVLRAAVLTPALLLRAALPGAPLGIRAVGRPDRHQRRFLLSLVPEVDLALAKWAASAILDWRFDGQLDIPVHHLHGTHDWLIPARRVRPTALLEGAGHAMNVTHARTVNAWLRQVTRRATRGAPPATECAHPHRAATAAFEKSR